MQYLVEHYGKSHKTHFHQGYGKVH